MTDFRTYPHLSAPFPHLRSAPQTAFRTAPVIGVRGAVRGDFAGSGKATSAPDFPHLIRTEETMSNIEPHAVITVSTPAIRTARQDPERTLADYLANIARRFPECLTASGAANPVALARRENRAMRKFTGHQESRAAATVGSPASSERVQAQRAAWESRRAARELAILDFLSDDFRTSGDVATRFKVSIETAQQTLRKLKEEGLIVTAKTQRVTIYRKATMEAAE